MGDGERQRRLDEESPEFPAGRIKGSLLAGKAGGPDGFANFVKAVRSALPDINATIQTMVAEGDHVAMWNTTTATHRGELFGMPPSGKQIRMKDFHFFRFRDGKIVEHWNQVAHLIAQD